MGHKVLRGMNVKAMTKLTQSWGGLMPRLRRPDSTVDSDLQQLVNQAHREWQAAEEYFQTVSDPALVDYAIYCLEAAKLKYIYLFRQMRQQQSLPLEPGGSQWT